MNYLKLVILALVALIAAMGASWARDIAYQVHALIIMSIAGGMFLWVLRHTDEPERPRPMSTGYADGVIRAMKTAGAIHADLIIR